MKKLSRMSKENEKLNRSVAVGGSVGIKTKGNSGFNGGSTSTYIRESSNKSDTKPAIPRMTSSSSSATSSAKPKLKPALPSAGSSLKKKK